MMPFEDCVRQVIEVSAARFLTDIALTGFLRLVIAVPFDRFTPAAGTPNTAIRPA